MPMRSGNVLDSTQPFGGSSVPGNSRPGERAHVCNCIGCCHRCGSCRTAPWHTQAYCDLLVRQHAERMEVPPSPTT